MVGKNAEKGGIAKDGANGQAVATATVPKVTIIIGGGFGAEIMQCGKPSTKIFVGLAQCPNFSYGWNPGANVLSTIKMEQKK